MAQHPEKLKWKDEHPYGLSASQFGMALGFCGRISDYVHYLRHVVGTEGEFKGNTFTAHGINTEPKSRALYELLTGCKVHDGGFFVTADRILGCSPDGQIFHAADEPPIEQHRVSPFSSSSITTASPPSRALGQSDASSSDTMQQLQQRRSSGCSVRVPFKSARRARSPPSSSSAHGSPRPSTELIEASSTDNLTSPLLGMRVTSSVQAESPLQPRSSTNASPTSPSFRDSPQKVRLLEIKSPFRALYDCTKPGYEPFGIPLHYMCQIQGQLAIANCEECDFFIYLDHPCCQVEAWRVRRCRPFWQWAEPNLRQVSNWVKDGPPDWLNRSFAFTPFDFRRIEVLPLVFPYDITATAALTDARRFAFFAKTPSPYAALERRRDARGGHGRYSERASASLSQLQQQVQEWCEAYSGVSWFELTEYERIALTVQTPIVRYLFENNDTAEGAAEEGKKEECASAAARKRGGHFCQTLAAWRQVLEAEGLYVGSATAQLWKSLLSTASAGRDPLVRIAVSVPEDWEEGTFTVRCTVLTESDSRQRFGKPSGHVFEETVPIDFFQRHFLAGLLSIPEVEETAATVEAGVAANATQRSEFAAPLSAAPIFVASRSQSLHTSQHSPPPPTLLPSPPDMAAEYEHQHSQPLSPTPSSFGNTNLCGGVDAIKKERTSSSSMASCISISSSPLTQERQRVVQRLSQQIMDCCKSQPCRSQASTGQLSSDASRTGSLLQRQHESAVVVDSAMGLPGEGSQTLRCEICPQDLYDLVRYSEDCEGVVLIHTPSEPPLYYRFRNQNENCDVTNVDGYALVVGDGETMRVLLKCCGSGDLASVRDAHPLVLTVGRQMLMGQSIRQMPPNVSLVPCFIDAAKSVSLSSGSVMFNAIPLPESTPCFVVKADVEASSVVAQVRTLMESCDRCPRSS